jgi:endo-1,4-beta-D-glucanase Y
MYTFRKASAKSVMFVVDYDDARRAYLWIDDPEKASNMRIVETMARTQQEQGTLPEGTITQIRRVR